MGPADATPARKRAGTPAPVSAATVLWSATPAFIHACSAVRYAFGTTAVPGPPAARATPHEQPYVHAQPSGQQPGPPPGRPARKSWPQRHKVLSVLGCLAALIIVIGGIASASGKAKQADNASAVATTTPTHTATPSRTPTHHATSAGTVPTKAPVTVQANAPAPAATTPAPVATTRAPQQPHPCRPPLNPRRPLTPPRRHLRRPLHPLVATR